MSLREQRGSFDALDRSLIKIHVNKNDCKLTSVLLMMTSSILHLTHRSRVGPRTHSAIGATQKRDNVTAENHVAGQHSWNVRIHE